MKFTMSLVFTLSLSISSAQESKVDQAAVMILDRMAAVIGDLQSCTYTLSSSNDVNEYPHGMVKKFTQSEVYMLGPNKMLVQSRGNNAHKGLWYNGEQLVHYSYKENNYTAIEAPGTILAMIDTVHSKYGVEISAADFFYPTFTDDILEHFDKVELLGVNWLDKKECFHLRMENEEMITQIWITNDALTLPAKMVIQYVGKEGNPQYEATFTDWELNPVLPEAIFGFTPPPGARQVAIAAKAK